MGSQWILNKVNFRNFTSNCIRMHPLLFYGATDIWFWGETWKLGPVRLFIWKSRAFTNFVFYCLYDIVPSKKKTTTFTSSLTYCAVYSVWGMSCNLSLTIDVWGMSCNLSLTIDVWGMSCNLSLTIDVWGMSCNLFTHHWRLGHVM